MSTSEYPRAEGDVRPFRLWDAQEKKPLRWRYYVHKEKAHIAALIEVRWAAVGTTIEVYNATSGKLLGQYTRKVNRITFTGA
jgi:hypothetical protein